MSSPPRRQQPGRQMRVPQRRTLEQVDHRRPPCHRIERCESLGSLKTRERVQECTILPIAPLQRPGPRSQQPGSLGRRDPPPYGRHPIRRRSRPDQHPRRQQRESGCLQSRVVYSRLGKRHVQPLIPSPRPRPKAAGTIMTSSPPCPARSGPIAWPKAIVLTPDNLCEPEALSAVHIL